MEELLDILLGGGAIVLVSAGITSLILGNHVDAIACAALAYVLLERYRA